MQHTHLSTILNNKYTCATGSATFPPWRLPCPVPTSMVLVKDGGIIDRSSPKKTEQLDLSLS